MDNSLLVRVVERPSQLPRQLHRLRGREWPLGDALGQRRPLHQLHDQAAYAVRFFQSVDGGDVGMVERSQHPRLALEPRQAIGMVRKALGQDLQSHVTVQLAIPDAIYLPHSARSQRAADFIMAEVVTDRQQHSPSNDSTLLNPQPMPAH